MSPQSSHLPLTLTPTSLSVTPLQCVVDRRYSPLPGYFHLMCIYRCFTPFHTFAVMIYIYLSTYLPVELALTSFQRHRQYATFQELMSCRMRWLWWRPSSRNPQNPRVPSMMFSLYFSLDIACSPCCFSCWMLRPSRRNRATWKLKFSPRILLKHCPYFLASMTCRKHVCVLHQTWARDQSLQRSLPHYHCRKHVRVSTRHEHATNLCSAVFHIITNSTERDI